MLCLAQCALWQHLRQRLIEPGVRLGDQRAALLFVQPLVRLGRQALGLALNGVELADLVECPVDFAGLTLELRLLASTNLRRARAQQPAWMMLFCSTTSAQPS